MSKKLHKLCTLLRRLKRMQFSVISEPHAIKSKANVQTLNLNVNTFRVHKILQLPNLSGRYSIQFIWHILLELSLFTDNPFTIYDHKFFQVHISYIFQICLFPTSGFCKHSMFCSESFLFVSLLSKAEARIPSFRLLAIQSARKLENPLFSILNLQSELNKSYVANDKCLFMQHWR